MSLHFTAVRRRISDITRVMRYGGVVGAAPTVSSLNYTLGDPSGGNEYIVITGTDLSTVTSVTFGGASATINSASPTSVNVTLPPHAAGVVDVVVTNPTGSYTAVAGFEYWSPAQIAASGWWRSNYSGTTGWSANASAGASGANGVLSPASVNSPPAGAGVGVGGHVPAAFDGAGLFYTYHPTLNMDSFATVVAGACTEYCFIELLKINTLVAPVGAAYDEPSGFTDNGSSSGSSFTSNGARVWHYDGGFKTTPAIPVSSGQYFLLQRKYDGTNLSARVGGGSWQSTPAGVLLSAASLNPRVGINYSYVKRLDGSVMEVILSKTVISDSTLDKIRLYCNQRYGVST